MASRRKRKPSLSKEAPRRRPKPSTPPSRVVLFTIAFPLVAFLALVVFVFTRKPSVERSAPAPIETKRAATAAVLTETELKNALVRGGIASTRVRNSGSALQVETPLSPQAVAEKLRALLTGAEVAVRDNVIEVAEGKVRRLIEVEPLALADSGAGLVEDESEEARPTGASVGRGRIAIILDDVGFANQPLSAAASLGVPMSFAIIPHTARASEAANMLHARGYEVLCHLPMEPIGFPKVAPGANAILMSMTDAEIRALTSSNIRAVPHARGVNNHMGSRATTDRRVMTSVLSAVRQEGAFFVDSRTAAGSVGADVARRMNVRTVSRDVFLDDSENEAAVRKQVERLAEMATKNGTAVGIGHVYPMTIKVLKEEVPKLRARGYEFIRVSEVVQ